jgi:hypothetical protein
MTFCRAQMWTQPAPLSNLVRGIGMVMAVNVYGAGFAIEKEMMRIEP